jgi:hypothetical protein
MVGLIDRGCGMMNTDGMYYFDFDLGAFRYAAARYVKLLIRARWKVEPGFLPRETLTAWGLANIESDRSSAWQLLADAAQALGHLNTQFLPRCGSGGVSSPDESTPEGRLIVGVALLADIGHRGPEQNGALLDAAQRLREGTNIDWSRLVAWETLKSIRAGLDLLPHPRRLAHPGGTPVPPIPPPRLILDQESKTITLDGTPYPGIDPVAFQIFEAIWNADPKKVSSTTLLKLPGLRGKNISRELKKLPEDLRILVQGAPGSGYWMELPPPTCL